MKAGVFLSEKADLIFVSAARTIQAVLRANGDVWAITEHHALGYGWVPKVWTYQNGELVKAQGELFDGIATRVTDAPKKCTDHLQFLRGVSESMLASDAYPHVTAETLTPLQLAVLRIKAARYDYINKLPNVWSTLAYEHPDLFPAEDEGCFTFEQSVDLGIKRSKS